MRYIEEYVSVELLSSYGFYNSKYNLKSNSKPLLEGIVLNKGLYTVYTGYCKTANVRAIILRSHSNPPEWYFGVIKEMKDAELEGARHAEFLTLLAQIATPNHCVEGKDLLAKLEEATRDKR